MLALLAWSPPSPALDTLAVGMGTGALSRWRDIAESSSFLNVGWDSVWVWDTAPHINLAAGALGRKGFARALIKQVNSAGIVVNILDDRPGLSAWIDGDPATAWGPDEDGELSRQAEIILDLGAVFRANRIRLYPRLDSQHSNLVLGNFEVGASEGGGGVIWELNYQKIAGFSAAFPNRQPIVDLSFSSRELRYVRLHSGETEPWELAELEVYSDGTVPVGEFVSVPLFVRGGYPIWGRVLANDRDASASPFIIQTRTGPDPEPLQYFLKRGDDLEKVSRKAWLELDSREPGSLAFIKEAEQGPVLSNPRWSPWQTVTDGAVTSPGPQRYLQFRVLLSEPGTSLRTLAFEYVGQPLAEILKAEIDPAEAEPGQEIQFTLSLEVQLNKGRGDTGVRHLQVLTPARVSRVEQVLVDDEEVVYSATYQPEGFSVDLWQRVVQPGSFVQVVFRAAVFRDGTPFQVRALDRRPTEEGVEEVYQNAREADVDPLSLGGSLVVRLRSARTALVNAVKPLTLAFTPNGDGINDFFEVSYNLLKLLRPAPISFAIFDLSGRQVRQGYAGEAGSGQYLQVWDGRDDLGRRVPPGIYLYQIEVKADAGTERRQGVVQVAY
jgi:hypothetical protein